VGIALEGSTTEQAAIKQGSMVEPVFYNSVIFTQERSDHTHIGHVTTGKHQCPAAPGKGSQFFFQGMVGSAVATDQVRGATAGTKVIQACMKGLDDIRMTGQPKVIIAAKTGDMLAIQDNFRALGGVQRPSLPHEGSLLPGLQLLAKVLPKGFHNKGNGYPFMAS